MHYLIRFFQHYNLHFFAIVIAIALWLQVHGQGEGSLSMDVPLQLQGLPADMMIVNDFPEHVRITLKGLQSRLKELRSHELTVPLDVSDLTTPSVVERGIQLSSIVLPAGLRIEKLKPERLQLQVDRRLTRSIPVGAHFELPEGWRISQLHIEPKEVRLTGPDVWLEALREVQTTAIRPALKAGPVEAVTGVASPAGKSIRLVDSKLTIKVHAVLERLPVLISRAVPIQVRFSQSDNWRVADVEVVPKQVMVTGPYLLIEKLKEVMTDVIQPPLQGGAFSAEVALQMPSGDAVTLTQSKVKVNGVLESVAVVENSLPDHGVIEEDGGHAAGESPTALAEHNSAPAEEDEKVGAPVVAEPDMLDKRVSASVVEGQGAAGDSVDGKSVGQSAVVEKIDAGVQQ
ncbi:MAG: CdaR family protein [Mariprofundus sp.]|nr:CdaR family protein [Mariprofundus sp.]